MKRILFLTFALMTALAACSKPEPETGGSGTGNTPPDEGGQEEVIAATIGLSADNITLGGSMFDTAEVSVTSNQTKITPVCNQTWMTATMTGKILVITASEANETGARRTGTVTVTAGEGDNTATATLNVTQDLRDASTETPVIVVTGGPSDMDSASGATTFVTFTTNQSEVTVSFAETQDWITYEVTDGKVTFSALNANTTGGIRTIDVTLTAGTATASVTIRQFPAIPEGLTVGAKYEDGMIFEIAADYIKIISLTEGKEFWASDQTKASHAGTSENPDNGQDNTGILKNKSSFQENYPAAAWCTGLGEGWYMPSRKEIGVFIDNLKLTKLAGQESANSFLTAHGGAPLTIGSDYYWTCCEHATDASKVWCVRLNDKAHGNYNKKGESGRPVRAVKKIEMDVASEMDKVGGSLGNFTITEETWTNN